MITGKAKVGLATLEDREVTNDRYRTTFLEDKQMSLTARKEAGSGLVSFPEVLLKHVGTLGLNNSQAWVAMVLLTLKYKDDYNGFIVFPSVSGLSKGTGWQENTVRDALRQLAQARFIRPATEEEVSSLHRYPRDGRKAWSIEGLVNALDRAELFDAGGEVDYGDFRIGSIETLLSACVNWEGLGIPALSGVAIRNNMTPSEFTPPPP